MEITLYTFNKRINSTKVVNTEGTTANFTYKDESDLYNPVILLNYDVSTKNYAKIGNLYYFITSVTSVRAGLWRAYLQLDVLATFKTEIINSRARVLYSANNYSLDTIDTRVTSSGKYLVGTNNYAVNGFKRSGCFFITVLNTTDTGGQFTTTYAIPDESTFATLIAKLNSDEASNEFWKWWDNPFEAIVEIYWLPVELATFSAILPANIRIGDYLTGVSAYIVKFDSSSRFTKAITIQIPWKYSDFRNLEPYTSINLYLPWVGLESINASDVYGTSELYIQYSVDLFTGNVIYEITSQHENVIATFSGNTKVLLPHGSDVPRVSNALNVGAGIIATMGLAGAGHPFASLTSGVYTATNALNQRQYIMNGSFNGSTLSSLFFPTGLYIWVVSKETYVDPTTIKEISGLQCGRVLTLSECIGYTLTENASVSVSGYYGATTQINSMLDGGVYIE